MGTPVFNHDNRFARSYDLAALPETVGRELAVECVQFGIQLNWGGAWAVAISIYHDTDGGTPNTPTTDLVLLGTTDVIVPASIDGAYLTAQFDPAIVVPVDAVIVVEMFLPDRSTQLGGDRGGMIPGSNPAGQTAPSYLMAPTCSIPSFTDLATLGAPDMHLVQRVVMTELTLPCPWDCGDANGAVGIVDFLALLSQWGSAGGSCAFNGTNVGIVEFLELLGNWGNCP